MLGLIPMLFFIQSLLKNTHFRRFTDKTGLCFETEPDGMRMPKGQVTTIT
jgi:hypothetical protein